jgi:hypothetical protein
VSNNIVSLSSNHPAKSSLDQFFPERALALKRRPGSGDDVHPDLHLAPSEVTIDLLEQARARTSPELWPIIAAGFVAVGVSILALSAVATLGYF